jgi:probable HAF family extracellular repeat protein
MRRALLALALLALAAASTARGAAFVPLGDLPGGTFASSAQGVSGGGSVVVGIGTSAAGSEAFRWTSETGMVGLGLLPNAVRSFAYGVSTDGSTIVGYSDAQAFRWTSGSGMVGLGFLPGGSQSQGSAVSADGSVVVGFAAVDPQSVIAQAFRWTPGTGMLGLGYLPGGPVGAFGGSYGRAVSADGSVVVGYGGTPSGYEAFRWTSAGGMVGLGDLAGGSFYSAALGISADGSTIVGESASASGQFEAFRWTSATGMVGLGDLAGGDFTSSASGVSADGSIVVGTGTTGASQEPFFGDTAFIWTQAQGMRNLKEVLTDEYGLDLAGWTLSNARAISADGHAIVGFGTDPAGFTEAWLALIPEPSTGLLVVLGLAGLTARPRRSSTDT